MGAAYPCFCTKERLARMREEQQSRKEITRYDRRCRDIPPPEAKRRIEAGDPYTIRLKVPLDGAVALNDIVHGPVAWDLATIEDTILLKSDGFPTYHLAVVVDDHVMKISHILRGEEWLASYPKHYLIYRDFGWDVPPHAHLPSVLGPDHKKLSKRHGSTAVREFREQGYIPEGLVNFLALIGWSPGTEEEVFSMDQLIQKWRLDQVQKAGGIWDKERLDYFNGVHIRMLDDENLAERLEDFLPAGASSDLIRAAAPLVKGRIKTLADARQMLEFLFVDELEYPTELLVGQRQPAEVRGVLELATKIVTEGPFISERLESALHGYADQRGWKRVDVDMPVPIAVTGQRVGPPVFESMALLGLERSLERLRDAIARLSDPVAA